jgi:hypothetical protein
LDVDASEALPVLLSGVGWRCRRSRGIVTRPSIAVEATIAISAAAEATVATTTEAAALATTGATEATFAITETWPTITTVAARSTITRFTHTFSEGQQSEVSCALDRGRERPLVLGAVTRLAAWLDHATLGDEAAQTRNILVIDMLDAIDAECADLAP